jgi:hypothetical protein
MSTNKINGERQNIPRASRLATHQTKLPLSIHGKDLRRHPYLAGARRDRCKKPLPCRLLEWLQFRDTLDFSSVCLFRENNMPEIRTAGKRKMRKFEKLNLLRISLDVFSRVRFIASAEKRAR